MKAFSDEKIVDSWKKNVSPWIAAIKNGEIDSRVQTTNQAILASVNLHQPKTVLDIGCGEGWLVRELTKLGIDTLGLDAVADLINSANGEGGGKYRIMSYEDISLKALSKNYDVVVSNFSLLGEESVENIFREVPSILTAGGCFIVQTIHPITATGKDEYKDGWREGNWNGFSETFTDPAPWYFRTIDSWKSLFETNGFKIEKIEEPKNTTTEMAASIIFTGSID